VIGIAQGELRLLLQQLVELPGRARCDRAIDEQPKDHEDQAGRAHHGDRHAPAQRPGSLGANGRSRRDSRVLEIGDEARTQLRRRFVDVDLDRVAAMSSSNPYSSSSISAGHQAAGLAHQKLDHRVLASGQSGGLALQVTTR